MMSRDCVLLRALGRDRRSRGAKLWVLFRPQRWSRRRRRRFHRSPPPPRVFSPWLFWVSREERFEHLHKNDDVSSFPIEQKAEKGKKKRKKKKKKKKSKKMQKKRKFQKKKQKSQSSCLLSRRRRLLLLLPSLFFVTYYTKRYFSFDFTYYAVF